MITIIYPYRNRETSRIKRSLDSLGRQTNNGFNVIFVDYGSSLVISEIVRELVSTYKFATYIYSFSVFQPWSRSKALNIGLRNIKSDYVFTADVDMIFSPDFVAKLYDLSDPLNAYYFKVGFLTAKESVASKEYLAYKPSFFSDVGAQGLSLFPVKQLNKIVGFDEFFHFWGAEDADVHNRLKLMGCDIKFYDKEVLMLHQWHKNYRNSESRKLVDELQLTGIVEMNHAHLLFNLKNNIKETNSKEWGKVISEKEFNELESFDEEVTISNRVEMVDHFLFVELAQFKGGVIAVRFVKDTFQSSLRFKVKKMIGKRIPKYYSLKEINDKLLLHIVSFYHQAPYTLKISDDLKSISFKIILT